MPIDARAGAFIISGLYRRDKKGIVHRARILWPMLFDGLLRPPAVMVRYWYSNQLHVTLAVLTEHLIYACPF